MYMIKIIYIIFFSFFLYIDILYTLKLSGPHTSEIQIGESQFIHGPVIHSVPILRVHK